MKKWIRYYRWQGLMLLTIVVLSMSLLSCAEMMFYGQAVNGHWRLLDQRRSVDDVLADPETAVELRQQLQLARALREFASYKLLLPNNDSYRSYTDVQRPYVVYNVFAAPELSLQAKSWCFPFAGCVGYRGYFNLKEAEQFATQLSRQNQAHDVYVAGVPAYSTLGWFGDPLLNTFMHWPEGRLAELIFHELAHQRLYITDDTPFNESFATAVGVLGTQLWLQDKPTQQQVYEQYRRYRREFLTMVLAAKNTLAQIYTSNLSRAAKHNEKERVLNQLQQHYQVVKQQQWQGYSGYDHWFAELNNAKLTALSAYNHYVPAFISLYNSVDKDFDRFYVKAAELGHLPYSQREQRLQALLQLAPTETTKLVVTR